MSWDVGAWVANVIKEAINTHKDATDALGAAVKTGSVPVVRKIQRGTAAFDSRASSASVTLSGFTNLNKMVVLIDGDTGASSLGSSATYVSSLERNKLSLANSGSSNAGKLYASYQVIEFY